MAELHHVSDPCPKCSSPCLSCEEVLANSSFYTKLSIFPRLRSAQGSDQLSVRNLVDASHVFATPQSYLGPSSRTSPHGAAAAPPFEFSTYSSHPITLALRRSDCESSCRELPKESPPLLLLASFFGPGRNGFAVCGITHCRLVIGLRCARYRERV